MRYLGAALWEVVRYFHLRITQNPSGPNADNRDILLVAQCMRGAVATEVVLNNSRKVLSQKLKNNKRFNLLSTYTVILLGKSVYSKTIKYEFNIKQKF